MTIVHLTASTFFGGPERQMLGLAAALHPAIQTLFLSFGEHGRCELFLAEARKTHFAAESLRYDTPRLDLAVGELAQRLQNSGARVLCCHGYKAGLTGLFAARRAGIPVVAVSRGWTGENLKVRFYERLDRLALRWMDRVVCVSEGQAVKVRRAGVAPGKVVVIPNSIRVERFQGPDPACRQELQQLFSEPRSFIVAAVGRLSPEKGFEVLVEAAANVLREMPSVGFVLFGDGPLRERLLRLIDSHGLDGRFILGGFRTDLDRYFPCFDLLVQSSYTEGMPNVVLESMACGVPVVATAVGGTPEVVHDGVSGFLVPPGDSSTLARRILEILQTMVTARRMGSLGRERVKTCFQFETQATQYRALFAKLF